MDATIGATAVNRIPVATNQAILAICPKPELASEFAALQLRFRAPALARLNVQSTQRNINKGIVASFALLLPSLDEQRAIASVLRTVQQAKEACGQAVAATRQLKDCLLHHLFTHGAVSLEAADKVELVATEQGAFPTKWKLQKLGELIGEGPQNGLYKHQSHYGSGTPVVRIDDYPNEGGVLRGAAHRVRLTDQEITTYALKPNDILVNRVNSLSHLGKAALVGELEESVVFESNMMRFSVKETDVLPEFAFRFLCTKGARVALRGRSKRAVAQSSVNQGDVQSLLVPLPPLSEQRQIAALLSTVDAKAVAERSRLAALDAVFNTLLQQLMTGKVRLPAFVTS